MDLCADLQEIGVSFSHVLSTVLLLQQGYLENIKLNKSDTAILFFLLIGPDMHPARVDNRNTLFIVKV